MLKSRVEKAVVGCLMNTTQRWKQEMKKANS